MEERIRRPRAVSAAHGQEHDAVAIGGCAATKGDDSGTGALVDDGWRELDVGGRGRWWRWGVTTNGGSVCVGGCAQGAGAGMARAGERRELGKGAGGEKARDLGFLIGQPRIKLLRA